MDSKFVKQCSVVAITLLCCFFATKMTTKQVVRFLENDDSTTIHFRQFNLSPKDKYPTFTICLTGSELYWNKEDAIFNSTELTPNMFGKMLKGQDAFSYRYNHTSMLYYKIPVELTDHPIMDVGELSLKVSEIVTGLEYLSLIHI